MLERDDFAKRYAEGRRSRSPSSSTRSPGVRLRRPRSRRRARRHGPEVQPPRRPHRPGALRPRAPGLPHHAAPPRDRRRTQDVQVVRQLHWDRRAARRAVREDDVDPGRTPRRVVPPRLAAPGQRVRGGARTRAPGSVPRQARTRAPIVDSFHDAEAAERAEAHFDRLFKQREAPEEIPEVRVSRSDPLVRYSVGEGVSVTGLLVAAGVARSRSEAVRLVDQGGIRMPAELVEDRNAHVQPAARRRAPRSSEANASSSKSG